jgi:hypothetical protein
MRRINFWYLAGLGLWILLGISFVIYNRCANILSIDDTNLVLGIISVAVSILSLGLATMKQPKFRGKVTCWNNKSQAKNVNNSGSGSEIGLYNWISFEIQNKDKEAIKSLVVNFRFPKSIYCERRGDGLQERVLYIKDSVIYTSAAVKFLGTANGDCELTFEHLLRISEMGKPNIYVTVSGENIRPTTFKIDNELGAKIEKSDSRKKVELPNVK